MGKSTTGPDMTDCLSYIHSMDKQNSTRTTVLLIPDGTSIAPSCTISLLSVFTDANFDANVVVATTTAIYPVQSSATWGGCLYRAIVEHDKHISSSEFEVKTRLR